MIAQLAACACVSKGEPLCLIGDGGTGKSHLLIALGAAAAMARHRVRYVLAPKLVNELVEAADERVLSKTITRYGRVDLLCIDELGVGSASSCLILAASSVVVPRRSRHRPRPV